MASQETTLAAAIVLGVTIGLLTNVVQSIIRKGWRVLRENPFRRIRLEWKEECAAWEAAAEPERWHIALRYLLESARSVMSGVIALVAKMFLLSAWPRQHADDLSSILKLETWQHLENAVELILLAVAIGLFVRATVPLRHLARLYASKC